MIGKKIKIPEGWINIDLSKELFFIKGKAPNCFFDEEGNNFVAYLTPEYLRGDSIYTKSCLTNTAVVVDNNDLIILWDGSNAGEIFRSKNGALASTMCKIVFINERRIDSVYLFYQLKFAENLIKSQVKGSGIPHVDKYIFKRLDFNFPKSLPEQSKIAEILSTVDEAIDKTEALIQKYRRIKQGLMQDLLTKGIDEKGNIRSEKTHKFKNSPLGRIPEEWEVNPIGKVCKQGGGSIQTGPFGSQLHAKDYRDDGIPIITVEHLAEGKILHQKLPLVGEEDYRRLRNYILKYGDLVFSRVGAIDRCSFASYKEEGWLFSGRCLRVRGGSRFDAKFLSYLLNYDTYRQWILNNAVGSTMKCLNTTILSSLPIKIPKLPEQSRIASILSQSDEAIQKEEAYKQKLLSLKRGLMEDLLTGRVRVNSLFGVRWLATALKSESKLSHSKGARNG